MVMNVLLETFAAAVCAHRIKMVYFDVDRAALTMVAPAPSMRTAVGVATKASAPISVVVVKGQPLASSVT